MSTDLSSSPAARDLPRDAIVDILSRVPVRSLLRFKSVCKSWYALLQNPNFTAKHFHQITTPTTTITSSFLFMRRRPTDHDNPNRSVSLLLSSNHILQIPLNFDIPFLSISKPLRISGSCNGLVCLSVMPIGSIILLWNPATRQFKDLPVSPVVHPQPGPIKVVLGFGFDPDTNDYKVVRIVYFSYPLKQVEVYSLSTNSWREVKAELPFIIFESSSRVLVKGRLHWTALGVGDFSGRELVVSFDMAGEVFGRILLPNYLGDENVGSEDDDDGKYGRHLAAMRDSLVVIVYPNGVPSNKMDIWVMNEYGVESSWTKFTSLGPFPSVGTPLGCGKNDEVLLHNKHNGELVLYDLVTREYKAVPVSDVPYNLEVFSHMESLLPIKGGKAVEESNLSSVVPDLYFVRDIDLVLE